MKSLNTETSSLHSLDTWPSESASGSKNADVKNGVSNANSGEITSTSPLKNRPSNDDDEDDVNKTGKLDRLLVNQLELEDAYKIKTNRESAISSHSFPNEAASVTTEEDVRQTVVSKVFTNRSTGELSLPPDGGYGWVCCACLTVVFLSTWGASAGSGIFLAYYLNTEAFPGATKYDYALIAGFNVFGGQGFSPPAMILARMIGFRATMCLGVVILFTGFFLASFATKLWQLYLTQGFLFGLGIAFVFIPATTILPGWFLKKRSTAFGISYLGTGAGGVIYSISVQEMITKTGNQRWALRMLAIVCAATCTLATILLRQRVPSKPVGFKSWCVIKQQILLVFQWRVVKTYKINLVCVWTTFTLFGYNLMIFTLSPYGVSRGLSSKQSSLLTIVLNAAQCVGRPTIGVIGDRYGRVNTTVVLTSILAIFLFAFWIPSHTFVQLIMFSICMGLCIGVGNVMSVVLMADISGTEDFLPAWGYSNTFTSPFLLLSEVIAQALVSKQNQSNPYLYAQIFAGICFLVALVLVLLLRETIVKLRLEEIHRDTKALDGEACNLESNGIAYANYPQPGFSTFLKRMFHRMKV
ncbi:LAME_0H05622g1_1 [Lachancea meyersii CBS 8951]|uniref:LAME_0H05622g1_1 n=1 Tax=Lachancea meyersii CBS 8951 TaxID=1266667 RepID=A0A1G4KEF3_9SACH|nr:LAME_0H05622g1_1 [Lachancea meyersii CBS 8951]